MSLDPMASARAVDPNHHAGVVIARAPERIDDRREVALGAPREGFAVGRGVLAQAVERRSVFHLSFSPETSPATWTVKLYGIAVRETAGGVSSEPKRPKKSKASSDSPIAEDDRAGNQRDNKTYAGTIRCFTKRLPVNSTPFS